MVAALLLWSLVTYAAASGFVASFEDSRPLDNAGANTEDDDWAESQGVKIWVYPFDSIFWTGYPTHTRRTETPNALWQHFLNSEFRTEVSLCATLVVSFCIVKLIRDREAIRR